VIIRADSSPSARSCKLLRASTRVEAGQFPDSMLLHVGLISLLDCPVLCPGHFGTPLFQRRRQEFQSQNGSKPLIGRIETGDPFVEDQLAIGERSLHVFVGLGPMETQIG
jgi:hypothetical protein